jgi:hypothetical protein
MFCMLYNPERNHYSPRNAYNLRGDDERVPTQAEQVQRQQKPLAYKGGRDSCMSSSTLVQDAPQQKE